MAGEHIYGTVVQLLDVYGQEVAYVQLFKSLPELDLRTLLPRITAYKKDEPHFLPIILPLTVVYPCPMYFMPLSWAADNTDLADNLREQRRVFKLLETIKRKLAQRLAHPLFL